MMDPILDEFTALMATVPLRAPAVPFLSNVTGTWITEAQATDPAYWAAHLRRPVRFGACVATLLAEGTWALVECGPGRQLANLARMQVAKAGEAQRALTPLGSLPGPGEQTGDLAALLGTAGALWCAGRAGARSRPTRRRGGCRCPRTRSSGAATGSTRTRSRRSPRRPPRPAPGRCRSGSRCRCGARPPRRRAVEPLGRCLVLADGPRGEALVAALRAAGDDPVEVRAGEAFAAAASGFRLRPGVRADAEALVAALGADVPRPGRARVRPRRRAGRHRPGGRLGGAGARLLRRAAPGAGARRAPV